MEREDVRNAFFRVELLRRRLVRPYIMDIGLTVGQGQPRILKELREKGAMTQKELADICILDVATMSRTLDRLEQAGLIKRESNPESRRSWNISLTPDGEKMADKAIEIFNMTDDVFCKGITDEELNTLCEISSKIENNIIEAIEGSEKVK